MKMIGKPNLHSLMLLPCGAAMMLLSVTVARAATYSSTILGDSPVAYYRLEELSGTTAVDETPNHLDATYAFDADTNGVTFWPELGLPGITTNSILFRHYVDQSSVFHHGF